VGLISPTPSLVGRNGFFLFFFLLASLLIASARAEVAIPPLTSRVTDLTDTLNPQQRAALEQKLAAFESAKGSQIVVLIVPTTQPEAIEQYSIRVVEQWKPGRKEVDDGALLLVAKDDRKMRLEVGRGLEGAVPDAVAKRITADIIAPYFKKGDFAGGITAGVERLIKVIEGEPLPEPPGESRPASRELEESDVIVIGLIVVAVIVVIVVGSFLCAWLGRFGGSAVLGGATSVVAWAITGSAALSIFVAICGFVLGVVSVGVLDVLRQLVGSRRGGGSGRSWGALGRFGGSAALGGAAGLAAWTIAAGMKGAAELGLFVAICGFILGMGGFRGGSSSRGSWSGGGSGGGFSSSGGGFSGGGGDFGGGGASSSW